MIASERSLSVWKATAALQEFPPLLGEVEADVCVVGAGISGMSVAYHLARAGRRVVVLDDNAVGGGETAQTTAHLFSANDDRFFMVERVHGAERARVSYASHQAAIERVAEVVAREGIDCDLARLDGYLFLGPGHTPDFLRRELEAAHRAGFTDAGWVDHLSAGTRDLGPALRFPRQGQFHPLRYLAGLARCIVRDGGRIHTGNHVAEIEGGSPARVAGEGFAVRAGAVVVATNAPINDRFAIHTKQAPYRTFVIAARVPAGAVPAALYWDTLEHYHYVRVQRMEDDAAHEYLIVGGEDHKTGHQDDAADRYARLEAWARERFPVVDVAHRWSGQFIDPVDYVGFIGRDPAGMENVYVATGDSGHGMTHGTIAGMLISDLILGRPNEWEALYDPRRKPLSRPAMQDFVYENADVALQYVDRLPMGGDVASADQIAPGTGALLQRGTVKIAAYRDERGVLHECVASCTHLGCVVQWNSEEKSWDCPCHGSRFSSTGEMVLNGPALYPLKRLDEAQK